MSGTHDRLQSELLEFLDSLERSDPFHYRWLTEILYEGGILDDD